MTVYALFLRRLNNIVGVTPGGEKEDSTNSTVRLVPNNVVTAVLEKQSDLVSELTCLHGGPTTS